MLIVPYTVFVMESFYVECEQKLNENSIIHENGECIIWRDCVNAQGYGQFRYKDPVASPTAEHKTRTAHRVALMAKLKNFSISAWYHASHLCNNKLCVNTDHLVFETSHNNCLRRTCFRVGKCNGHFDQEGKQTAGCLVDL